MLSVPRIPGWHVLTPYAAAAEIDVLYENHIAARHFAKTDTAALMH